ncbi:MAG: ABC transporter permease [Clostridiaceae bacterium]
MTAFKYMLKLAFKQKLVILAYFAVFAVMAIGNSGTSGNTDMTFSENRADIKIINKDNSEVSSHLEKYLKGKTNETSFDINENNAEEMIFLQAVDAVVIIPQGFGEEFLKGKGQLKIYSDPRVPEAVQTNNLVTKYLIFAQGLSKDHGSIDYKHLETVLDSSVKVNVLNQTESTFVKDTKLWFERFMDFLSYSLSAVFIAIFGNLMRQFTLEEISRRNAISKVPAAQLQLQLMLSQLLVAIILGGLLFAIMLLMKPNNLDLLNIPNMLINLGSFILTSLGIATLISTISKNKFVINALGTVIPLGLSFISGVILPFELLSPATVTLSKFFPFYYYVKANENIFAGRSFINEIVIQLLFAALFFTLSITLAKLKRGERILVTKPVESL